MVLARFPRSSLLAALAALPLAVGCGPAPETDGEALAPDFSSAANAALSGAHYNLNLIGVSKEKSYNLTGGDGRRIFVPLYGKTSIYLYEGDFEVLDANGTDGRAAFQLPSPDPYNTGYTTYSVWARALGKPGGNSSMTTCATEVATGDLYCSVYSAVSVRDTGRSSWDNVSKELLYIYADMDGDGYLERYPLFDDALQDYYWYYDNNGLKVLQLRFYEQSTDVNP